MEKGLNIVELSLGKLDWAKDMNISQEYEDFIRNSGGLEKEVHFYVIYNENRKESGVRGYLTVFKDKESDISLSLYKGTDETIESPDFFQISRMDMNKAVVTKGQKNPIPEFALELSTEKVLTPYTTKELDDYLSRALYTKKSSAKTLREKIRDFGGDDKYAEKLAQFFDLDVDAPLTQYERESLSFFKRTKHYISLFKKDPEYRRLQIAEIIGEGSEGFVNGLLTGLIFKDGAVQYGISVFMGYVNKFVPKLGMSIFSPIWGNKVDRANEKTNRLEALRSVEREREVIFSCSNGFLKVAMRPEIIEFLKPYIPPYLSFGTFFLAEQSTLAIKDAGAPKTSIAIREELIQNNPAHQMAGYDKELFQLIGTEESVMYATHALSAAAGIASYFLVPELSLWLSLAGMLGWVIGKTYWTCYKHNPQARIDIDSYDYFITEKGYNFNPGIRLDFQKVVSTDSGDYLEPLDDYVRVGKNMKQKSAYLEVDNYNGDWGVMIKPTEKQEIKHKRKFLDRLGPFKKLLGRRTLKETWSIGKDIFVQKYDGKPYSAVELSDGTFLFGTEKYLEVAKKIYGP
jgi:hypothetical protein